MSNYPIRSAVKIPAEHIPVVNAIAYALDPSNGTECFTSPRYSSDGSSPPTLCGIHSHSTQWMIDTFASLKSLGTMLGSVVALPYLQAAEVSIADADLALNAIEWVAWDKETGETLYPPEASGVNSKESAFEYLGLILVDDY